MNEFVFQSQRLVEKLNESFSKSAYLNIFSAFSAIKLSSFKINNEALRLLNSTRHIYNITETTQKLATSFITSCTINIDTKKYMDVTERLSILQNQMNSLIVPHSAEILKSILDRVSEVFERNNVIFNRFIFLEIADEIGFPIYLEIDTDLQDRLIESYRLNDNTCNLEEMRKIIIDYYNDDYVNHILNGIQNVGIFNKQRVKLIGEGIEVYKLGYYGASAAAFADYISGMIRDVYSKICELHYFTEKEKEEIGGCFNQKIKSKYENEKGMLLQIVCSQDNLIMIWHRVAIYFTQKLYASGEDGMNAYPKRHMICHGIQVNHDTREMNLILIMCMDILSELAWRVRKIEEEKRQIIISL